MTRSGSLLALLFIAVAHTANADDAETLRLYQELAGEKNKGVVMELERDANPGASTSSSGSASAGAGRSTRSATSSANQTAPRSGGKQVELIVGGQGEDGIAKRGELSVEP